MMNKKNEKRETAAQHWPARSRAGQESTHATRKCAFFHTPHRGRALLRPDAARRNDDGAQSKKEKKSEQHTQTI